MTMLQALLDRRDERFQELELAKLAQEAQHATTDILVRTDQVITKGIADQNHFWQQLAIGTALGDDLPVQHHQLLQLMVVLGGTESVPNDNGHLQCSIKEATIHCVPNHRHQHSWHVLVGQQRENGIFHTPVVDNFSRQNTYRILDAL